MKLINRLLIALALFSTGSLALAAPEQDHGRGHGDHDRDHHGHDRRHDNGRWHGGDRRWDRDDHRRYGYYRSGPRYYGHPHRWERGHRYEGPTYVVRNYGYYRLRQPPRGYHWVRADNDYLLVAIATGIILDVALH
ncbi:transmembrane signal peptide protein [Rhodanobacter glycinis]|uniref:Transmembrane signal peptide protein n=1 Tax=Rhodanobacter glycinis TaxID=582702 RepID=A0A502BWT3_9GAMM|nr:RcnB family protein [Rhodanobacter glycinis]TPG04309.1 transmembrane signal peptide protein [Rhodanobacter glycinis]TPG44942.1 transmembrane signal peptide protein [Rhodanobacter glycinis]